MFSKWSSNSIALAIVTPSLVIVGEPYDCSKTTLRPLGPNVDLTVSANWSTPFSIAERASSENFNSLAIISIHLMNLIYFKLRNLNGLVFDCNDIFFVQYQILSTLILDFGTGILIE